MYIYSCLQCIDSHTNFYVKRCLTPRISCRSRKLVPQFSTTARHTIKLRYLILAYCRAVNMRISRNISSLECRKACAAYNGILLFRAQDLYRDKIAFSACYMPAGKETLFHIQISMGINGYDPQYTYMSSKLIIGRVALLNDDFSLLHGLWAWRHYPTYKLI